MNFSINRMVLLDNLSKAAKVIEDPLESTCSSDLYITT
ncbi:DNA polymerase III, beta subunit [unidentified plasmid]|nr:DNA polymerase III, beta subunit [unidentified plasmid] [Mycoplasma mycoides subsp. capri str. GM12]